MERDIPKILIGKSLLEYFSYYHVTQKMIHRLEQEKRVLINHTFLPFNTILKENDQLTLKIEDMEENHTRPFSYPLDIVYEDSDFIVINKPPFILIHPDGTDEEFEYYNYCCKEVGYDEPDFYMPDEYDYEYFENEEYYDFINYFEHNGHYEILDNTEIDYKLIYPTKIKKLKEAK